MFVSRVCWGAVVQPTGSRQASGIMTRHLTVLTCMALVASACAAHVSPASASSMLKLRSNLNSQRNTHLVPSKAAGAEYFTSPVSADEEMLCLRMRLVATLSTSPPPLICCLHALRD